MVEEYFSTSLKGGRFRAYGFNKLPKYNEKHCLYAGKTKKMSEKDAAKFVDAEEISAAYSVGKIKYYANYNIHTNIMHAYPFTRPTTSIRSITNKPYILIFEFL